MTESEVLTAPLLPAVLPVNACLLLAPLAALRRLRQPVLRKSAVRESVLRGSVLREDGAMPPVPQVPPVLPIVPALAVTETRVLFPAGGLTAEATVLGWSTLPNQGWRGRA